MGIMAPERLCKQPYDKLKFNMSFDKRLASTETISTINSITSEKLDEGSSTLSITSSGIASDSKSVDLWIASGTAGEMYRVEIRVTTSASQNIEGDGILWVRNK